MHEAPQPSGATTSVPATTVRPRWAVPPWLEHLASWTARLLVVGLGIYATIWLLARLGFVVVPVLVALLITALLTPAQRRLEGWGVPSLVSVWVLLVVTVAVLGATTWLVATSVGSELSNQQWEEVGDEIEGWLATGPLELSQADIDELREDVENSVSSGFRSVDMSRALLLGEMAGALVLTLILTFFFTKDGPDLWAWTTSRIGLRRRATVSEAGDAAFAALGGYMRGVAVTGLVDAVAIGIGLYFIGVPLAFPLALLTFFAAFFPLVGATVVGALAALLALVANGPQDAILVIVLTVLVQQIEGDLIMPLVMRRTVRLHPGVILVALAAGGALGGIVGSFVAVPVTAMASAAGGVFRQRNPAVDSSGEDGNESLLLPETM